MKMKEKYLELQQSRKRLEDEMKRLGEKLNISENAKISTSHNSFLAKVPEVTTENFGSVVKLGKVGSATSCPSQISRTR